MIKAIIFDQDGTLIQTEILKATSYGDAIAKLSKNTIDRQEVIDNYERCIGVSREDVLNNLVDNFGESLIKTTGINDTAALKAKILKKRLGIYKAMLEDARLLQEHFCIHTLDFLKKSKLEGYRIVLATMSHWAEVEQIIKAIGIYDAFDFILTREDVQHGKPQPDIYMLAQKKLGLRPHECLVVEDSLNGVKAALAAGLKVFAVTNIFTHNAVVSAGVLPPDFIIENPADIDKRIGDFIVENR
ncbi:MAG: hypothetical protein CL868_10830 [Cytophagaceae bacterium]|nr:hypothetical protein [Cytophagaceae bacterium]|tara:strand:+ start:1459 stop:2190 length:732 start_codon:yes stop_codon:yes gene_type:complete